tara:strand:+ start:36 stop:284 length:249 start_codon:yes stop_codon:yes gene_type:complete
MPIYIYACSDCGGEWKESHSMHEEIEECSWCESANIYRKPSLFCNLSKQKERKQKVGSQVRESIEDSRKDLEQQKEGLKEVR